MATKHVLSLTLHRDLSLIQKSFAACVTQDQDEGDSIDPRNLAKAADTLSVARDLMRNLKLDYEARTTALKEKLQPYEIEKKAIATQVEFLDDRLSKCLIDLYNDKEITKVDGIDGRLSKVSICEKSVAIVEDASLIPDEYLLPREKCIDMAKLEQARKDGVVVPGAGVKVSVSFRTTLKEQIEV